MNPVAFIAQMISFFKSKQGLDVVKYEKCTQAYTNNVFMVECNDNKKYIYKKFENRGENEQKISNALNRDLILVDEDNQKIEHYINHTKPDIVKDYREIVVTMKKFHMNKVEDIVDFNTLLSQIFAQVFDDLTIFEKNNYNSENNLSNNSIFIESKGALIRLRDRSFGILESNKYIDALCHNDLHSGNILKTEENKLIFIDFDYSTLNNKLFDIANYFCETRMNYSTINYSKNNGLTDEQEREFIKLCLDEVDDKIIKSIKELEEVSHMTWIVWAFSFILNKECDNIFYLNYILCRLEALESDHLANNILSDDSTFLSDVKKIKELAKFIYDNRSKNLK